MEIIMSEDENGKITLAVLSLQISTLTNEVAGLRMDIRNINNAIADYRVIQSRHDTEIKNLGTDYSNLSTRVNGWSAINSGGVIMAAILGIIFGNRQP